MIKANGQKVRITTAILAVVLGTLLLVSCGDDYEKPTTAQSGSALISALTLKDWVDTGKVNGTGYDRVVILDVSSTPSGTTIPPYYNGHIPGARYVDPNDISQTRTDGVAAAVSEVPDGSKMDNLIQGYGIDGNTTIVFTGSSLINATRAYFTFRYWGFSKSRLKLLNGLNAAWNTAYGLVQDLPPDIDASSYSVKNNRAFRGDLRVSLSEMIDYADGKIPNVLPVDVRGSAGSYAGTRGQTSSIFAPSGDFTVFEGRIRGAQAISLSLVYDGTNNFYPSDQLAREFTAIGLDSTMTAYVYCKVGFQASVGFFALDGILGWPVALYDGSWSQWGQLSGNASMKGQLSPASPWRTDIPGRSDVIAYNYEPIISTATFSGTGVNDLLIGTVYTSATTSTFTVQIESTGPDTFQWTSNGGTTWTTGIAITGSAQSLVSGLTVSFGSAGGHGLSDSWTFTATARKAIEQLTADGTSCSAAYSANGTTITNSINTSGTACTNLPVSFDTDANRIEDADKAYMGSGGSAGGGGGTTIPAGC